MSVTTRMRLPLSERLRPWHWIVLDLAGAALAAVAVVLATGFGTPLKVLGVAAVLPVVVRRLWPVPVLVVMVAGMLPLLPSAAFPEYPVLPLLMAVYTVTVTRERRRAVAIAGAATAVLLAGGLVAGQPVGDLVRWAELIVPGLLAGELVRSRRTSRARLAEQREQALLIDERMRIAREVHDVVAHQLSVITIQAGAARYKQQREQVLREALGTIEVTGREALVETRRLLGMLRGPGAADFAPAPGLAGLDALIARAADAGLRVEQHTRGRPWPLPAGADLAAYRIVQEALTNTVQHAGTESATVVVGYEPNGVVLEISNPPGRSLRVVPAASGHGLVGMRERVAMFGGSLRAGPAPDGGYLVTARLPVAAVPERAAS